MNIDVSDEATGLPPMDHPDELSNALLALTGAKGGEGIATIPGSDDTVAVKYLHLRGLIRQDPYDLNAGADWAQVTLAIPAAIVDAVIAALAAS